MINSFEAGVRTRLEDMAPPPFMEDLRKLGIYTDENTATVRLTPGPLETGGKEKVKISTDVHPAQARIMSHVIEKKLVPGLMSRGDYARAAIFYFTAQLVKNFRDKTISTAYYLMEMEHQVYATRLQYLHADKSAEIVRKSAQLACRDGDTYGARETLRNARSFMDMLGTGTQERFSNRVFGSADGKVRPENWEGDEVAQLWKLVLEEERDEEHGVEVG